jgi:hypothetical protein
MNYVIGLCKGNKAWASVLRDLQYSVEYIEQSIRTSSNQLVKPDVIKVSKKRNHAIVIDCKSGTSDADQLSRYNTLTKEDLLRWVDVPSKEQFTFDVCVVDFENNHKDIMSTTNFPIITFSKNTITKSNNFSETNLDSALSKPIDITEMMPPSDYYPFSEFDTDSVIIPRVLRIMVTVALKKMRGGQDVFDQTIFTTDEILQMIHPLWKALSVEHRESLRERIRKIIAHLMRPDMGLSEHLHNVQRDGFRIRGPAESFTKLCEKIIADSEGGLEQWFA